MIHNFRGHFVISTMRKNGTHSPSSLATLAGPKRRFKNTCTVEGAAHAKLDKWRRMALRMSVFVYSACG